jgi:O-antigen ligase
LTIFIGLTAATLVFVYPILLLGLILLFEQYPAGSIFPTELPIASTLGSNMYDVHKYGVPATTVLAILALIGCAVRLLKNPSLSKYSPIVLSLLLAISLGYAAIGLISTINTSLLNSLFAVLRNAAMWLTIASGLAISMVYVRSFTLRAGTLFVYAIVIGRAMINIYTWVSGQAVTYDGIPGVVSYGPVLPLLGSATLLSIILLEARITWRLAFGAGCGFILILGAGRVTFIVSTVILIVILAILFREGWMFRRVAWCLAAGPVAFVGWQLIVGPDAALRVFSAIGELFGLSSGAGGTSADLHYSDIAIGLRLALQHPVLGVGPESAQPAELANFGAEGLYIHNEFLQQWLRYGILGIFVIYLLMVFIVSIGLVGVSYRQSFSMVKISSLVLLSLPIALFTAPFLSTEQRIPLIVGACIGIVIFALEGLLQEEQSENSASNSDLVDR